MGSIKFIRYPGGKQRLLNYPLLYLSDADEIKGKYIMPFDGGESVFFMINPSKVVLSDIINEVFYRL